MVLGWDVRHGDDPHRPYVITLIRTPNLEYFELSRVLRHKPPHIAFPEPPSMLQEGNLKATVPCSHVLIKTTIDSHSYAWLYVVILHDL